MLSQGVGDDHARADFVCPLTGTFRANQHVMYKAKFDMLGQNPRTTLMRASRTAPTRPQMWSILSYGHHLVVRSGAAPPGELGDAQGPVRFVQIGGELRRQRLIGTLGGEGSASRQRRQAARVAQGEM